MLKALQPDTIENGRAYFNKEYYQLCAYLQINHFIVDARSYQDKELFFNNLFLGLSKIVTLKKYRSADPAKVKKELPKLEQRLTPKDREQLRRAHIKNQAIKKMICIAKDTFGDLLDSISPSYADAFTLHLFKGGMKINIRNFKIVTIHLEVSGQNLPLEAAFTAKNFNFLKDKNLYASYNYDHIPIEELPSFWQDLKRNTLVKRIIAESMGN